MAWSPTGHAGRRVRSRRLSRDRQSAQGSDIRGHHDRLQRPHRSPHGQTTRHTPRRALPMPTMTSCSHTDIMRFTAHTSGTPRYTQAETASSAKSISTRRYPQGRMVEGAAAARPAHVPPSPPPAPRARLTSKHARIRLCVQVALSKHRLVHSVTDTTTTLAASRSQDAALREPPVRLAQRVFYRTAPPHTNLVRTHVRSPRLVLGRPACGRCSRSVVSSARPRHLALCRARVCTPLAVSPSSSSMGIS